ncbi:hypothetical protein N7448_011316 [Penicillium atrosanguineum]|nr:hypothetical protein N7448_011316 [Penicillium atrosanguineum]
MAAPTAIWKKSSPSPEATELAFGKQPSALQYRAYSINRPSSNTQPLGRRPLTPAFRDSSYAALAKTRPRRPLSTLKSVVLSYPIPYQLPLTSIVAVGGPAVSLSRDRAYRGLPHDRQPVPSRASIISVRSRWSGGISRPKVDTTDMSQYIRFRTYH